MASYIAWYGNKQAGFRRREAELLRILANGGGREAIERAAEEVRAARIRALKSDRARIPGCGRDDYDEKSRRLDEEIARCSSRPVNEIVAEYRSRRRAPEKKASDSDDPTVELSDA